MVNADLIARLEAATGPSRELDLELWWACKANHSGKHPMEPAYKAQCLKQNDAPRYTFSIDAALSLVPDNNDYCEAGVRAGVLHAACWQQRIGDIPAWRIAILVTIAALKAREVTK